MIPSTHTVFYNRAFRVQCYLYHPRVHSACSVAIATNDKLSHENAPLSLHVLLARAASLSFVPPSLYPQRISISLNRYGRRLIRIRAYTRIRLYVRRPMKYSRHAANGAARLVCPGQIQIAWTFGEKEKRIETGKLGRPPILFECTPRLIFVRSFGRGLVGRSIEAH